MTQEDSTFVFAKGDSIVVGEAGQNDVVFANGSPVFDDGESTFSFEKGVGINLTPGGELVDDWEDNDTQTKAANWSGWFLEKGDGTLTAQSNTVINGSYTGKYELSSGTGEHYHALRDSSFKPSYGETYFRFENFPGDKESFGFSLRNGGPDSTYVAGIIIDQNDDISASNGRESDGSVLGVTLVDNPSTSTVYRFRCEELDFSNNTYTGRVVDTSTGTEYIESGLSFVDAASGVDTVRFGNDYDSGTGFVNYTDDIRVI